MTDKRSSPDPSAAQPAKPPKRKGRWRRWLTILAVVGLFLVVAARVVVVYATPSVLHGVAARYGLSLSYDRMELYLLAGDVGLSGVKLGVLGDAKPAIRVGYCRLNLSPLELLKRRLLVHRLEADGVDVDVTREADGTVPLLDQIGKIAANLPASAASTGPRDIDLTAPFQVEAFRLQHVRASLTDLAVTPPIETRLELDVRVSDVGEGSRPTTFSVGLTSPPLLDSVRIEGQGMTRGRDFSATMDVMVLGIHPRPAGGYASLAGLRPTAEAINLRMRASAKGTLVPPPAQTAAAGAIPTVRGNVTLDGVTLTADGVEAAALKKLSIDADSLDGGSRQSLRILVEGAHASARRTNAGLFGAAGFELASGTGAAGATPATRPAAASVTLAALPPIDVEVSVKDSRVTFADEASRSPTSLTLDASDLVVKGLSTAATTRPQPLTVAGRLGLPGVVRQIDLEGTGQASGGEVRATVKLNGQVVRPDALRPYLDALGVASEFEDATLAATASVEARLDADGTLGPVRLHLADASIADGAGRGIAIAQADVSGLALTGGDRPAIRVASVLLEGPELGVTLTADGQVRAAGLRTLAARPSPAHVTATSVPTADPLPATITPLRLPRIEVGQISWRGLKLRLRDETVTPPFETQITDAGAEGAGIVIDPGATPARTGGTLRAWLNAPDLAGKFEVNGKFVPESSGAGLELAVSGSGIRGQRLNPYLRPFGIESTLRDGAVSLRTRLAATETNGGGLAGSVVVESLSYSDEGTELAGVDSLRIAGVRFRPGELRVGSIDATRARARLARDADGSILAAGLRVPPETLDRWRKQPPASQPTTIELARATVTGARIALEDRAARPAVETELSADAEISDFVTGKPPERPAKFTAAIGLAGTLDRLNVTGTLALGPTAQSIAADVDLAGLRSGPLAAYIPPGVRPVLTDGRIKAHVEASVAPSPGGGLCAELSARDVDYRDGEATPLVALSSARVAASRFDWAKRTLALDEISVAGLRAKVELRPGGATRFAGVDVGGAVAPGQDSPAAAGDVTKTSTASPIAAAPPPRLVTVEKLDLRADELSVADARRPQAVPLVLTAMTLRNHGRIELLGDDAAAHPPAGIEFNAGLPPLAGRVHSLARVTSSGTETGIVLDLTADGIRGQGLTLLAPELAGRVDGSQVSDGRFKTHVEASVRMNRRALLDLDFSKPFDADLLVRTTEFRATPDGPVLAGVDELNADGIRVNASRGDLSVQSLDVTKPAGVVVVDGHGINAFGWTVRILPVNGPNGAAPNANDTNASDSAAPADAPPNPPSGEIKVGTLTLSGLDFRFEDRTSDPPLVVPLNGMDLTVRGLTTRALAEDRPVQFSASVTADKVQIPRKTRGGARRQPAGPDERPLFSQASANGVLSLYPKPRGWAKGSVSGLELAALRGPASRQGVEIGAGTFDGGFDLRLKGDGSLDTRSTLVVTDLSVTEAPDGPINRTLRLPAPLDVVIATMEAPDGSITVPLKVTVRDGELTKGQIAGAAAGAMANVVATAMASAPVKVGSGVVKVGADVASLGGLLPLGSKSAASAATRPAAEEIVTVTFAPGAVTPDPAGEAALREVAARMKRKETLVLSLRHTLCPADEAIVAGRANPPASDVADMARSLRQRKATLTTERAALAARARALLASRQDDEAARAADRLRAAERDLEAAESRLDALYELLRPGADRQASRRTRAACIELGDARLAYVRTLLAHSGVPRADERVQLTRPSGTAAEEEANGSVAMTITNSRTR